MVSSDDGRKRKRSVSPPVIRRKKSKLSDVSISTAIPDATPAAVEAGLALVTDHLEFYTAQFTPRIRSGNALLSIEAWQSLWRRNQHPHGHHFVIHQHDHPVAGTHYDLRLQINETSSCSWAIMYGLPGNPNSTHLNRNATETRIHCLWNHLIESASHATGSLLIWDTGEYEVVEAKDKDDDLTDEDVDSYTTELSESEKLALAFARGKIRLRLHGSRLPKGYVLYIRRPKDAKLKDRPPSARRRRRRVDVQRTTASDSDDAMGHSDDAEDETIRRDNAYPGARNSIGSIHQRTWYASMDRVLSGFRKTRLNGEVVWTKEMSTASQPTDKKHECRPFFVTGRDHERSVVTGRLAADIMRDEGVVGYVPRAGWRPILE